MLGTDWRVLDGEATAWYDAPSLVGGAALAQRLLLLSPDAVVDLRVSGLRVRLPTEESAEAVSAAARELGLTARPGLLQRVDVVLDSADPPAVRPFWQGVLDYSPTEDDRLVDPLRRGPDLHLRASDESRPLRNRIHLDVVRPSAAVGRTGLGAGSGRFGVCHADADGNEVDLVPGDPLGEGGETADWHTVFSAMACYRTTSARQQSELLTSAATLADRAGFPLGIDLRAGLVVLDSGKDLWDEEAHGLALDFTALAASIQSAARGLGATADAALPRFVQLFLDAADVEAVRGFWIAALGYAPDRRDGVTDIYDPRRLDPELVFQRIDASDTERRHQRNRIHVELSVAADVAPARLDAALAAGGRLLEQSGGRSRVADPEGNELVVVAA